VTHPFHPLLGREYEFVEHKLNWGEDRVWLRDDDGQVFSLPAGWTDAVAPDVFTVIAAGRCPFTADAVPAESVVRPGQGVAAIRVGCRPCQHLAAVRSRIARSGLARQPAAA